MSKWVRVLTVSLACLTSACGSHSADSAAAHRFLSSYVTEGGRVIRYDQGGDIVSEGQAYGMLIAEAVGESDLARRIWDWTTTHLSLPDGLFAWHASPNGKRESSQSASDADVLLAFALLRYDGSGASAMHRAGRTLAKAVLANEAVRLPNDDPVIVAGAWAVSGAIVDPSYFMPSVYRSIASLTHDDSWSKAASASVELVARLTNGGTHLPPDWARLSGSALIATSAPGTAGAPVYGFDAVRLPLFFASSCDSRARGLAAMWWWKVLSKQPEPGSLPLNLSGSTPGGAPSPVGMMSAAAAAAAAGDHGRAASLRSGAAREASKNPTYYGDAWVAIGDGLLTGAFGTCPP